MTELKKAAVLAIRALLIVFICMQLPPCDSAEATVIKDLRTGSDQAYVRLVLETDRSLTPPPTITIDRNNLRILLTDIDNALPELESEASRHDIVRIDVSDLPDSTLIETVFSFIPSNVRTFSLATPPRFVIDAYRPLASATGDPSDESLRSVKLTQENSTLLPPLNDAEEDSDSLSRNRFQQRLLAVLIIVTSIILILIIYLMCVNKKRK